jgi:hypothetical protein
MAFQIDAFEVMGHWKKSLLLVGFLWTVDVI